LPVWPLPWQFDLYLASLTFTVPVWHLPCRFDLHLASLTFTVPVWPLPCRFDLHRASLTFTVPVWPYLASLTFTVPVWPLPCRFDLHSATVTFTMPTWPLPYRSDLYLAGYSSCYWMSYKELVPLSLTLRMVHWLCMPFLQQQKQWGGGRWDIGLPWFQKRGCLFCLNLCVELSFKLKVFISPRNDGQELIEIIRKPLVIRAVAWSLMGAYIAPSCPGWWEGTVALWESPL